MANVPINNLRVVGIGEWQVSRNPGEMLRTYGLGSCVALILNHSLTKTAALAHILLPDSVHCPPGREKGVGYYADTAVPAMIREFFGVAGILNAQKTGVVAKMAGGATVGSSGRDSLFQVGRRNVEAVIRLLKQHHLPLVNQDIGGAVSRTVSITIDSGEVVVLQAPGRKELRL